MISKLRLTTILSWVFSIACLLAADLPEAKPLKVGVTPTLPPLVYKDGGKLVGAEADFAEALGRELSLPIKFVEVDWEDQIPSLIEGKTDIIMSSMSITRARQLRVAFSKPYLTVGQSVLIRREDSSQYTLGFPPIPKGTIGVLEATTGDFLVQQEFQRNKRKTYKSPLQAAKALQKKQIDLLICDSPIAWWLAGIKEIEGLMTLPIVLTEEPLAWAVRKSDQQLLESINGALQRMLEDGRASGILGRWMPIQK